MGKLFGIGLIVLGLWVGIEVYSKGTAAAFGGVFARFGAEQGDLRSPVKRIEDHANAAREAQLDRIERQLDDSAPRD